MREGLPIPIGSISLRLEGASPYARREGLTPGGTRAVPRSDRSMRPGRIGAFAYDCKKNPAELTKGLSNRRAIFRLEILLTGCRFAFEAFELFKSAFELRNTRASGSIKSALFAAHKKMIGNSCNHRTVVAAKF